MASKQSISVIIRTKDEEKWIGSCLEMVLSQEDVTPEVIVVDDHSSDRSREIIGRYPVRLLSYEGSYTPGKVLNFGIAAASGEFIVCLSGHCIPASRKWLKNLLRNFTDSKVAGVYGRQEPLPYSSPRDKRDLWTIFGLDKKVQWKDPFFHNANSMFRRSLWAKLPFDEKATNIEDRIWAKAMLARGCCVVYEPEASVYHWHGIHQNEDEARCHSVVRILESLQESTASKTETRILEQQALQAVCVIPVRGEVPDVFGESLLKFTIERALESAVIDRVIIATDNSATAQLAERLGAEVPFLRPKELSSEVAGLEAVLKFSLAQIEKQGRLYDNVLVMQVTNPFRPKGFVDALVREMLFGAVDTVIPVREDYRIAFKRDKSGALLPTQDGLVPRTLNEPVYTGLVGLGVLTKAAAIRDGNLFADNIGVHRVNSKLADIEVVNQADADTFASLLKDFWQNEKSDLDSSPLRLDQSAQQKLTRSRRETFTGSHS